jgi:hypothetical protein
MERVAKTQKMQMQRAESHFSLLKNYYEALKNRQKIPNLNELGANFGQLINAAE